MPTLIPTMRVAGRVGTLDEVEGVLRGYVFIWGSPEHRDSYDTYFDRARPPDLAIEPGNVNRPISYEHTMDGVLRHEVIGFIDRVQYDAVGLAYEGHLDRSSPFFARIVAELRAGELKTSSATMEHTASFYDDGAFRTWWLGELALTKSPAEARMPASVLVRSQPEGNHDGSRRDDETTPSSDTIQEVNRMDPEEQTLEQAIAALLETYTYEELMAALAQMAPAATPAPEGTLAAPEAPRSINMTGLRAALERNRAASANTTEIAALRTRLEAIEGQQQAQQGEPPVPNSTQRRAPSGSQQISVSEDLKYAHLTAEQMAFAVKVLVAGTNPLRSRRYRLGDLVDSEIVTTEFLRTMGNKVAHSVDAMNPTSDPMSQVDIVTLRSMMPFRTNELHATDLATHGAEWVEAYFDTRLWERARDLTELFNLMQSRGMEVITVPQGAGSMNVKLNPASGTVYTLREGHDADVTGRPEVVAKLSQITTGEIDEPLATHVLAHGITYQLEEDSVINLATWLPNDMEVTLAEAIESAMVNGDKTTTANSNINIIDGTPATGLESPHYLAFDGIRHNFLIDNPSYARDAGGALVLADFALTAGLLPRQVRGRKKNILFIVDDGTESAGRQLGELLTVGVAGQMATIYSGEFPPLFGSDTYMSGQMPLTNATGKVSLTAGNNTKGTLAAVYAPYWKYGRKRAINIETERYALSQALVFVATVRHAFKARGAGAAAGTYNIG